MNESQVNDLLDQVLETKEINEESLALIHDTLAKTRGYVEALRKIDLIVEKIQKGEITAK